MKNNLISQMASLDGYKLEIFDLDTSELYRPPNDSIDYMGCQYQFIVTLTGGFYGGFAYPTIKRADACTSISKSSQGEDISPRADACSEIHVGAVIVKGGTLPVSVIQHHWSQHQREVFRQVAEKFKDDYPDHPELSSVLIR